MSPLTGLRKRIRRICRNEFSDSLLLRISDPNRLIKRKIVFRGFRENRVAGFRTVGKHSLFVSRNRTVGFEKIVVAAGRAVHTRESSWVGSTRYQSPSIQTLFQACEPFVSGSPGVESAVPGTVMAGMPQRISRY